VGKVRPGDLACFRYQEMLSLKNEKEVPCWHSCQNGRDTLFVMTRWSEPVDPWNTGYGVEKETEEGGDDQQEKNKVLDQKKQKLLFEGRRQWDLRCWAVLGGLY